MLAKSLTAMDRIQSRISFRNKIFLFVLVSIALQLSFIGVNLHIVAMDALQDQVGSKALIQAREIATDPQMIAAVKRKDSALVDQLIERRRELTDSNFIVIGDDRGVRLYHPVAERIGQLMEGRDNEGALLRGEYYTSLNEGSLGPSVRGKAAIIDSQGEIVGVVSVGYLIDRFDQWLFEYAQPLSIGVVAVIIITLVVGWMFSTHIKRNMNGKEPAEIAFAYNMRKSILRSVYEGIIAIDKQGRILTVNFTALKMLGTDKPPRALRGKDIGDYVNQSQFFFHAPYDENLKNELITVNGEVMIANRVAIYDQGVLTGWVVSLRKKEELSLLTEELTQTKQYTDSLRAARDEYENKLSTICGLIEMGDSRAALRLIYNEQHRNQEKVDFVSEKIHCKQVAGIMIGKAARARVLGLDLHFSPECQLGEQSGALDTKELCAVLGNLLDNAFEATLKNPDSNKVVSLLITDQGKELVIEVKDNGCGIDPELAMTMFSRGVSSKEDEQKGVGLYLSNRYITNAGGVIMVDEVQPKGTVISAFVPKLDRPEVGDLPKEFQDLKALT